MYYSVLVYYTAVARQIPECFGLAVNILNRFTPACKTAGLWVVLSSLIASLEVCNSVEPLNTIDPYYIILITLAAEQTHRLALRSVDYIILIT